MTLEFVEQALQEEKANQVHQIEDFLQLASIVVLPSYREGTPRIAVCPGEHRSHVLRVTQLFHLACRESS